MSVVNVWLRGRVSGIVWVLPWDPLQPRAVLFCEHPQASLSLPLARSPRSGHALIPALRPHASGLQSGEESRGGCIVFCSSFLGSCRVDS